MVSYMFFDPMWLLFVFLCRHSLVIINKVGERVMEINFEETCRKPDIMGIGLRVSYEVIRGLGAVLCSANEGGRRDGVKCKC